MFQIKISVATVDFQQPVRGSLQSARRIGADGVQLDLRNEISVREYGETARRQLLHYFSERDLQAASTAFPLRSSVADPDRIDERIHALREAIAFTGQLKVRKLCLRMGRLPNPEDAESWNLVRDIMNELASYGDREGVTLCLKPAGDPHEHVKQFCNDVNQGYLAIDADAGGWILNRQDPTEQLRALHDRVQHVEIRDAVRNVDGLGKEVPVGRGEVDWDEFAALLGEMDYRGWLNVTRTSGNDPLGDIERAILYLKKLFPWEG